MPLLQQVGSHRATSDEHQGPQEPETRGGYAGSLTPAASEGDVVKREDFLARVDAALTLIPTEFRQALTNIAIVVEDEPSSAQLAEVGVVPPDTLFGLYEGTPLPERQWAHGNVLPDKITLFQAPIEDSSDDEDDLVGAIGETLIHEVGHQAAALLNLVESIRPVLGGLARGSRSDSEAWRLWDRWISEIAADFWSVARVGVASTMGLMGVVSLPRAFVFRLNVDDPHPVPWIRVKLSAALGRVLHPQPIWDRLSAIWESYYPLEGLDLRQREIFNMLERTIPGLVAILVNHRPAALRGRTLAEAMDLEEFRPELLRAALQRWRASPDQMYRVRPLFAFAVIGQGRAENQISPEEESTVLGKLLTHWALSSTMQAAAGCVPPAPRRCQCQGRVKRKQISEPTRSMSWSI